jgi:hypothetical protein
VQGTRAGAAVPLIVLGGTTPAACNRPIFTASFTANSSTDHSRRVPVRQGLPSAPSNETIGCSRRPPDVAYRPGAKMHSLYCTAITVSQAELDGSAVGERFCPTGFELYGDSRKVEQVIHCQCRPTMQVRSPLAERVPGVPRLGWAASSWPSDQLVKAKTLHAIRTANRFYSLTPRRKCLRFAFKSAVSLGMRLGVAIGRDRAGWSGGVIP